MAMAMSIAGTYVLSSNVQYRESYESAIQISMLTNELRDLPSEYSARMINTISDRSSSYSWNLLNNNIFYNTFD